MQSVGVCTFAFIDAIRDSCSTGMVASGKASFSGTKVPWSKPRASVSAGWKPDCLSKHQSHINSHSAAHMQDLTQQEQAPQGLQTFEV